MLLRATALTILLAGTTLPTGSAIGLAVEDQPTLSPPNLPELVETHFRTEDPEDRKAVAQAIEDAANGSTLAVVEAIRNVVLWDHVAVKRGHFYLESPAIGRIKIRYQVPEAYDPDLTYPMLVSMPSEAAVVWKEPGYFVPELGEGSKDLIVVRPSARLGGAFHDTSARRSTLPELVREVQRLFHVDTNRVYLHSGSHGGDAAWMAALMHADLFAGVACESSQLRLPYPEQSYPIFAGNISNLLPHGDQSELLEQRRLPYTRSVSKWFRYPGQGHAQWLRMTEFAGPIWEQEQLSIRPGRAADRGTFITKVLKKMLAYLGGRIEGQEITIETRKCARIDLLLSDELIDLDQPITVHVNGRRRHVGLVKRSISVLLQTAHEYRDFNRLYTARLSFSIARDMPLD